MKQDLFEHVVLGGLRTAVVTAPELARIMVDDCLATRADTVPPKLVFSSNGYAISMAGSDPVYMEIMRGADIIHADGMSVVFASRLLSGTPLPERVATTDFFHVAAPEAAKHSLRFFFLGGEQNVCEMAFRKARHLYPDVGWAGFHHGYFTPDEEEALCARIVDAGTDVLWVGLGRPKQEMFSACHRDRLSGVGWIKPCGGLFDHLAGTTARAPKWVQNAGFEWAWRVAQEPGRLALRYAISNVHAAWLLATKSGPARP